MKPTTQAKTINQLVNQLEAMEQILASAIVGAKELGLNSCRAKYAAEGDPNLEEALLTLRRVLGGATHIVVDKSTKEYRARTRQRNSKYSYLRTEYRARNTDCPIEKARLLRRASEDRESVKNTSELEARIKARQDREQQAAEQRENERKALQDTLQLARDFLGRTPAQKPVLLAA